MKATRAAKVYTISFHMAIICIIYPTAPVFLPSSLERYSFIYQQIELKLVKVYGFFSFTAKKKRHFLQKVEYFSKGKKEETKHLQQTLHVDLLRRLLSPESHGSIKTCACI